MNKDKKSNNDPTELSDLIADDLPKGVKYVLSEILGFKSYKKDLDRYCSLTGLNITKIGYEEDAGEAYPLFEFTNGEKIGIEEIRGRLIEYIKEVIKEENHIIINDTFESKKKN